MLKKNNVFIAIIITLFFLIIAYFTTFRIAIYSFVVCYIGVIIAKSKNKRLKVPVVDFFVLTFFVGIILALFYSYSPRVQYYEFVLLHSRWEISKVDKIEQKVIVPIQINSNFQIGTEVTTDLYFKKDSLPFKYTQKFDFFEGNLFDILKQDRTSNEIATLEITNLKNDLYIFKKPNKDVYKIFSKHKLFENSHSAANLVFSILFFVAFVLALLRLFFRPKKNISVVLNQYPKRDFLISVITIIYLLVYSIVTFVF